MTTDLINKLRTAAESLAVNYNGFMQANNTDDWNGLIVWGGMLLEAQEQIGIELQNPDLLRSRIATGRRRLSETQKEAA